MKRGSIFLAGFFGGPLPYLLGMGKDAVSAAPAGAMHLYLNAGYWVGTAIFGAIGGLVASYFGETELRKALAIGAAAPGFVLGLGQGGSGRTSSAIETPPPAFALAGWLVPAAYAQQPASPAVQRQPHDTLWVRVLGLDSLPGAPADLVAVGRPGPSVNAAVTYRLAPTNALIPLQRSAATGLFLVVGGARTDTISISATPGDTLTVRLGVRDRSFLSGLARTFGVRTAARQPTVTVVP